MATEKWTVTISGTGSANTTDPDDADEILKLAWNALKTAGHTDMKGHFETSTRKGFES